MKSHYKYLLVWRKAMSLATQVYLVTRSFPREELYGLTSQMRRAAVSVPSNIAEGQARLGSGEFRHFLSIAKGSLAELDTQLLIAQELGNLPEPCGRFEPLSEVGRMLSGLLASLAHKGDSASDSHPCDKDRISKTTLSQLATAN